MEEKHIEISLCRVAADGKHLDLIFNIPFNYLVTALHVVTLHLEGGVFVEQLFDIYDEDIMDVIKREYVLRIPLTKFGLLDIPAIYQVYVKARHTSEDLETEGFAVVSDVNDVYQSILDDILGMGERCSVLSDDAIKKYLILYGHQAALYSENLDEAKTLFKILVNNFTKCGGSKRKSNCGTSYNHSYVKSDCGCKL